MVLRQKYDKNVKEFYENLINIKMENKNSMILIMNKILIENFVK